MDGTNISFDVFIVQHQSKISKKILVKADLAAIVIDVNKPNLERAERFIKIIRNHAPNMALILIGNKTDLKVQESDDTDDVRGFATNVQSAFIKMYTG